MNMQWMNVSSPAAAANFSLVPPLTPGSALPLVHHLGDVSLRVRMAASSEDEAKSGTRHAGDWDFFSSVWGACSAEAVEVPARAGEIIAHDITQLLDATQSAAVRRRTWKDGSPIHIRRAYRLDPAGSGFEIAFDLTNRASVPIEIGAFGMSVPTSTAQDVHIGGHHGWADTISFHLISFQEGEYEMNGSSHPLISSP